MGWPCTGSSPCDAEGPEDGSCPADVRRLSTKRSFKLVLAAPASAPHPAAPPRVVRVFFFPPAAGAPRRRCFSGGRFAFCGLLLPLFRAAAVVVPLRFRGVVFDLVFVGDADVSVFFCALRFRAGGEGERAGDDARCVFVLFFFFAAAVAAVVVVVEEALRPAGRAAAPPSIPFTCAMTLRDAGEPPPA